MYCFPRATVLRKSSRVVRETGDGGCRPFPRRDAHIQRSIEASLYGIDLVRRLPVRGGGVGIVFEEDIDRYLDGILDVVEDDNRVGYHKIHVIGHRVISVLFGEAFHETNHVIADISDGAAEKAGQPLDFHRPIPPHELPQFFEGVVDRAFKDRPAETFDLYVSPPAAEDDAGPDADEAVAPPFFSPLYAFQEKGMIRAVQFPEGGYRGFHVGQELPIDRYEIAGPGEPVKFGK